MTENLLQKLEEKMIKLLSELEESRKELQRLNQKVGLLETERKFNEEKLKDILSLLDAVSPLESQNTIAPNFAAVKPVLVQG